MQRLIRAASALAIMAVGLWAMGSPHPVDALGAVPTIDPNVAGVYLGPEVVISGQARASAGIDAVSVVVYDVDNNRYVVNADGGFGSTATPLDSFMANLPPPGESGVSWRVPLNLVDGNYQVTITAESADNTSDQQVDFQVVSTKTDPITLIESGDTWAYYDAGDMPATNWDDPAYDDASWATGPSELGFGDGDEATVTNDTIRGNEGIITQYFRHEFTVGDLTDYSSVELSVLRDDGMAVYLNGVEITRDNLPEGTLTAETEALTNSESTTTVSVDKADLLAGTNLLAVEVHQVSESSSDISFDLTAIAVPTIIPLESDNTAGTYVLTAGDMAKCSFYGDEAVAGQMAELFDTDAGIFIGLGDLAYNSGTLSEFLNCYDPTIGQFKDVTWPSPGNHEHYTTPNAAGYRAYFGEAAGTYAGPAGGLWYAFDIDEHWIGIALDSDCRGREELPGAIDGDGCAVGSDQELWLRETLEANKDRNILAFFHHPPYTNNHYTDHTYTWPLWRALTEYGVELTLHGHEHHYERYAPLDYWGERSDANGTREFISGAGGTQPRYNVREPVPESDFKGTFPDGSYDFGVLQLWLQEDGYEWKWESIFDLAPSDAGTSGLTTPMQRTDISGTVVNHRGLPLADAQVCAEASRSSVETCAMSDSDGNYVISNLVADSYTVAASHDLAVSETRAGQALVPPTRLTVDFTLASTLGDVSCSDALEDVDVVKLLGWIVEAETASDTCPLASADELNTSRADLDIDGTVTVRDAQMMAQCIAGTPNTPCPGPDEG